MTYKAGIVTKSKFISSTDKRYRKAIDYISRDAAQRKQVIESFHAFADDSMLNIKNGEGRLTPLFTQNKTYLDTQEKDQLKRGFEEAKQNGSPMWQTVFSFDNEYLKEIGLYSEGENGFLNEEALRNAARVAMNKMIDDMKLGDTVEWAGAIHFNTDNIHIHTMMVVKQPEDVLKKMVYKNKTVYRGKIPPATQRGMKSSFANTLENREPALIRISQLLRKELKAGIYDKQWANDAALLYQLNQLKNELPANTRVWQYKRSEMAKLRPKIDLITQKILTEYHGPALNEFERLLKEQSDFYKRVYGENAKKGNLGKTYEDNKKKELREAVGNALLNELREEAAQFEVIERKDRWIEQRAKERNHWRIERKALSKIKTFIGESYQDFLNRVSYERDQREKEWKQKITQERDVY
ncbi:MULTISPECIES: MobP2 family relaxase [unclassified Enterococcus]|uniref:MobP2 family relaxase n=1 Tax=unclassified Enterococcus TaxID=2608891 RepID=UPI003F1EF3B6